MNNYQREYLGKWVKDGTVQPTPAPQVVIDPTPAQKELAELFGDECYSFEKTYDLLLQKAKDAEMVFVNKEFFLYIINKLKKFPVIDSFNDFDWYSQTTLELCGARVCVDYNREPIFKIRKKERLYFFPFVKS